MMEHPAKNLGFLLHDVARLMRKRFEQNARHLGLTRSQCQVLAHLVRLQGIHQSALAELLEIKPITLTRIVDRLEKAGLIERHIHPDDRRIKLLYLASRAHPLLDEIFAIGAATRGEALQGVLEGERERLFATLSVMKTNLLHHLDAEPRRKASHG
jgi:DNA-binding MarR family transcriptional regulator